MEISEPMSNARLPTFGAFVSCFCAFAVCLGQTDEEPLSPVFYVSFDSTITGHFGEHFFPERSPGHFRYEKGVVGQAALLNRPLEYPIALTFKPERGTFSAWLKLVTKSGSMVVPGDKRKGSLACIGLDDPQFESLLNDGEWHHFVYTWSLKPSKKRQFLDGDLIREANYTKPYLERHYAFGAAGNWIDELVLLHGPLSKGEVRELYAEYRRGDQPFRKLPRGAARFLPVDVAKFGTQRPAPHRGVDWRSVTWEPATKTRKQFALDGYWRFQPLGFMERAARPEDWLYVALPAGSFQPFDQSLKLLEGYNYHRRKMMRSAKTGADMPLTGEDEELPEEDDDFPAESAKTEIKDAGTYNWEPITGYCSVVLEREFGTPTELEGKQVLLRLSRAGGVHPFINGHYLGAVHFIDDAALDVTGYLQQGKPNRLTMAMGDTFRPMKSGGLSVAPWIEIRSTDLIKLGKPLIVSSTRQKALTVYLPADNLSGKALDLSVNANLYDAKGENLLTTLGPTTTTLAKDATGDTVVEFPAKALKEWSPESPDLYQIELEVSRGGELLDIVPRERFGYREVWAEGGDIYLNGKRLQLRGKGHAGWVAFTPLQIDLMRSVGMNSARTLDWNEWDLSPLDVTDEKGFLLNIPMWIDRSDKEAARSYFRKLMTHIGNHPSIIEWMIGGRGYVNGPHGHPMQIGGEVPEEVMASDPRYKTSRVVNEIDPTGRLTFYHTSGTGGNVRGIMHSLSFGAPIQEMEEWVSHWAKVKQEPFVPREQQIFSRPDYFFHRGSRESVVLEQHARYFGEAGYLRVTEGFIEAWKDIGEDRLWATPEFWKDFYELAFVRALRSWRTYGISGYWFHASFHLQTLFEKARSGGHPTPWGKVVQGVNAPCIFYIGGPEEDFVSKDHSYFAGETLNKAAIVVNDTLHDIPGTVSWSVVTKEGVVLTKGNERITAAQGKRFFQPLTFECPKVQRRTEATVVAKFDAPDEPLLLMDEFQITIFPQAEAPKVTGRVAVFDPSGKTAPALQKMRVEYAVLDEKSASSLGAFRLLIIGKNSYPDMVKLVGGAALNAAVEQGLNLLVLEQMNRNVAGLTTECFKTRRAFRAAGDSPVLTGLGPEDFIDWRGESTTLPPYQPWCAESNWRVGANLLASKHGQSNSFGQGRFWHWSNKGMVATFCYQKPQLGNYRVLLQNGFDCLYTPLVEFRKGKGRVVFCQLDVTDHYGTDPVATLLLDRLVSDCIEPAIGRLLPLGYLGGDEGRELLGLLAAEHEEGLDGKVAYLSLPEADDTEGIKAFIAGGGTAVVCLREQADADKLPVKVKIREGEETSQVGEGTKMPDLPAMKLGQDGQGPDGGGEDAEIGFEETGEPAEQKDEPVPVKGSRDAEVAGTGPKYFLAGVPDHPVFAGVSLSDLYYRRTLKSLTIVEAVEGKPVANPLIGVIPFGKGRIVYIQPDPGMFDDAWKKTKVIRLYNTVLTNLGVKSRVSPDFNLIGGYGMVEEWLPGYYPKVPDRENRPMVKDSLLYWKPALNFDPNVHYVW